MSATNELFCWPACITQSGEIIWKTRLEYDNGEHGSGGSPVVYDNLLIVDYMRGATIVEKGEPTPASEPTLSAGA